MPEALKAAGCAVRVRSEPERTLRQLAETAITSERRVALLLFVHDAKLLRAVCRNHKHVPVGLIRAAHFAKPSELATLHTYDFVLADSFSVRQALLRRAPRVPCLVVRNIEDMDALAAASGDRVRLTLAAGDAENAARLVGNLLATQAAADAREAATLLPRVYGGARVRICAYGFQATLIMLDNLLALLPALAARVGDFTLVVVSDTLHWPRAGAATARAMHVERHLFRNLATASAVLSTCDVGIVPQAHVLAAPGDFDDATAAAARDDDDTAGDALAKHGRHVSLEWITSAKVTVNGGRGYLLAQLGVPVVAQPEVETLSMLVDALGDAAAQRCVGWTALGLMDALLYVLHETSDARRVQMARALQQWSREHLSMRREVRDLLYYVEHLARNYSYSE